MATAILLRRVFVTNLNEFTTQWREYLFNTLDPDGPILENLVINSTAFELADAALIWTNPDNGDTYTWNATTDTVTKTAGAGPVIPPPLPDLSDPYGLLYVHEFKDWEQRNCRFEIYRRNYAGASEEIDGSDTNLNFSYENEGKVFVQFRGSMASLTLTSQVSKKFHDVFEADERDHYGRFVRDAVVLWTGWITPDIFSEPYANPPYRTTLAFNDGIGGLKKLDFPDVNANGFTGLISEKDAIVACLSQIGLRLDIHIACNIREEKMDTLSAPIEQSMVNVETFVTFKDGERTPIDCYKALEKILISWNAFILQEDNVWWIVREPELYADLLIYKRFDADGVAIGTATKNLNKTFIGEGIKLHRANLETKPAFTNVAVSQEYGELLVENGNFAVNGSFENWKAINLPGGFTAAWRLDNWTYDKLNFYPFSNPTTLGRVRRVTESTGLDQTNNYINIYEVVRSFADPVGRLISEPFPITAEVGNRLQVTFKTRCNTKGSDSRLVEAYFNIGIQCGSQWLAVNASTGEYEWVGVETRLRWRVAEVKRWETITIPAMPIPESGDVKVYVYQMVQVGSVSKVEYVADFDDVEIKLVDNPALQNEKIFYKTENPETYTSTLEEITIELGDVATVLSQNAKIIDGQPSTRWTRPGDAEGVPLAQLICRELANQYQRTTYRLKSGSFYADASRLTNYEDAVNEPDRRFLLTGGDWNAKSLEWNSDFVEINQTETTVPIRVVLQPRSGRDNTNGSNSGGGPGSTGTDTPTPPTVPVDLGDLDDVIPIIRDGVFQDSEIRAIRDESGDIIQYQFDKPVRGLPATEPNEFVIRSQVPNVTINPANPNGLSIEASTQVLSIGLASSVNTGALSGTDWNTFNAKESAITGGSTSQYWRGDKTFQALNTTVVPEGGNLYFTEARVRTTVLTDYTVGANTALAATDTVLAAFQKVQGQINARVSGTISAGQVAFGTGVNTLGGSNNLFWSSGTGRLSINTNTAFADLHITGNGTTPAATGSGRGLLISHNVYPRIVWENTTSTAGLRVLDSFYFNNIFKFRLLTDNAGSVLLDSIFTFNTSNGRIGLGTDAPTNTLDVNGTARIRTIANATGNFLTTSATGVLQQRNASETRGDIGAQATIAGTLTNGYVATIVAGVPTWAVASDSSKWTLLGSDIYRNSRVLVGGTTFTDSVAKQEIKGALRVNDLFYQTPLNTTISSITTSSINMTSGVNTKRFVLQADLTINFSADLSSNETSNYTFVFKQDSTGGHEVFWNTTGTAVQWQGGITPIISDGINEITVITILWTGQEYLGFKSCGF